MEPQAFYLILQIFLAVSASTVVVASFFRWADRKLESRIVKEIRDSTYQIQPNSNGGASLKDLHNKVDGIVTDVRMMKSSIVNLESQVQVLEDDFEDLR